MFSGSSLIRWCFFDVFSFPGFASDCFVFPYFSNFTFSGFSFFPFFSLFFVWGFVVFYCIVFGVLLNMFVLFGFVFWLFCFVCGGDDDGDDDHDGDHIVKTRSDDGDHDGFYDDEDLERMPQSVLHKVFGQPIWGEFCHLWLFSYSILKHCMGRCQSNIEKHPILPRS